MTLFYFMCRKVPRFNYREQVLTSVGGLSMMRSARGAVSAVRRMMAKHQRANSNNDRFDSLTELSIFPIVTSQLLVLVKKHAIMLQHVFNILNNPNYI